MHFLEKRTVSLPGKKILDQLRRETWACQQSKTSFFWITEEHFSTCKLRTPLSLFRFSYIVQEFSCSMKLLYELSFLSLSLCLSFFQASEKRMILKGPGGGQRPGRVWALQPGCPARQLEGARCLEKGGKTQNVSIPWYHDIAGTCWLGIWFTFWVVSQKMLALALLFLND